MATTLTTLLAKNEFTQSVNSSVNCFLLGSGDQLTRQITSLASGSWQRIRIHWKQAIVGAADTGNVTGVQAFIGLCPKNKPIGTTIGDTSSYAIGHYIGAWTGNSMDSTTLTADTDANTDPPNKNIGYAYTAQIAKNISGSVKGEGGFTCFIPRQETVWSSSHAQGNNAGYAWGPMVMELCKYGLNQSVMGVANVSGDNSQCCINVPYYFYRRWCNHAGYINSGVAGGVVNYGGTYFTTIASATGINGTSVDILPPHDLANNFDTLNVWFKTTTTGVKFAVRDITVTKLE